MRRLITDRLSVATLRLLGHRWPKQIEAGEPIPDWADPDGIIPITLLADEATLLERVEKRLADDEIDASDFEEVMGKPLGAWLATEFFKHHTKQFKKRPIAWQLQSGKFTTKRSPAFACLVYYHKLDADTLEKLRSQYVGPLRQRLETELRGIQSIAAEARSDRQEKRRAELDDSIQELAAFDAKLEQVAREGFATAGLEKLLADEPLDRWCSLDGRRPVPASAAELLAQESAYAPDINDGVRVNVAPLQKAGLLAADILAKKDLDKAIADRAAWRSDERRWVREGKLPQPGWWPEAEPKIREISLPTKARVPFEDSAQYPDFLIMAMLHESNGSSDLFRLARAYRLLSLRDMLVNHAPPALHEVIKDWSDTYCESPDLTEFREAVLRLVSRQIVDGVRLRDDVVALLNEDVAKEAVSISPWIAIDARLALMVLDAMKPNLVEEILTDDQTQQVGVRRRA
ncbi:MAG TPA: hypothetical protein VFI31_01585 [Pirellulales bacterium]|nr:hypothetical protein [Pirellulales bacterium]